MSLKTKKFESYSSSSSVGKKRALLIGLRYDQPQMIYTWDDCLEVEQFLIEKFNFPRENIDRQLDLRIFDNEDDKLTNITLEYKIKTFLEETKSGDVSILFVSGHGGNPKSEEGPGLIAAVDYQVLEVNDLIVHVKELPKDTKFLFIIDACFGANFMKLFSENVVMMLSSKETEESKGSIWYGSHSTNAFLHCVVRDSETTLEELLELIKIN
ncbi:metacaspase-6-like [Trifolium pratense]|uniref:metacaspase-6-like n=1 Tax=Trifolium pratense TaxID=57577 RepID=UPI001E690CA8|nr:metacaspase-6-like [Trifolium pratense]